MEQFNLDTWLQNKSRKVVVETGNEVKIISTEAPGDCPIVGYIYNGEIWLGPFCWNKKGISPTTHAINRKKIDLFFADEEELTEFEKMLRFVLECYSGYEFASESDIESLKLDAKSLLDLARKELEANYYTKVLDDRMVLKAELHATDLQTAYDMGKQDALKDLPKWKKVNVFVSNMFGLTMRDDDLIITQNGYQIKFSDLKTLPKEE